MDDADAGAPHCGVGGGAIRSGLVKMDDGKLAMDGVVVVDLVLGV
eukprot:CAMPEP_0201898324 /NCGR_PEP_ID=MMETSP0902-20130614/48312_1 /ASSEMBLY_ACC=CAM_ASM_000551 /TAXON_ID=420261 /ORGANISM="Thalassiosira antarctica, Strain CCMP982" /LENGTH=44 /DNA_ID= /DNA_START= /DNA_END= /DNA_ORIENTATION=